MASADLLPLPTHDPTFKHVDTASINVVKRKRSDLGLSSPLREMGRVNPPRVAFEPAKHLSFEPPNRIWSMEEIGLADCGISPNAVSEPFQLFSEDAIKQIRAEVLSKAVMENCQYSSNLCTNQLRGMAAEYAPFVYDIFRSPEVLSIVSKIAGVELVPAMDFELAHINISASSDADKETAKKVIAERAHREADEGVCGCPWEAELIDEQPIVDWHTDSYPFVCVTMLSDCTNMIGGETALRRGDGEVMKVRGPGMGNAVILQGRYIEHQALKAMGCDERITMVTSFRPKSAFARDDTVLTTVRPISNLAELYSQYSEYRFEMLEERVRAQLKSVRDGMRRRGFNTAATKAFIVEQKNFLDAMLRELVDDDKVTKGFTDDSHLLSTDLKEQSRKKARVASGKMDTAS